MIAMLYFLPLSLHSSGTVFPTKEFHQPFADSDQFTMFPCLSSLVCRDFGLLSFGDEAEEEEEEMEAVSKVRAAGGREVWGVAILCYSCAICTMWCCCLCV